MPRIINTFEAKARCERVAGDASFALVSTNTSPYRQLMFGPPFRWKEHGRSQTDAVEALRGLTGPDSLFVTAMNRVASGSDGTIQNRHEHAAGSPLQVGETELDNRHHTITAIFSVEDYQGALSAAMQVSEALTITEMDVLRSISNHFCEFEGGALLNACVKLYGYLPIAIFRANPASPNFLFGCPTRLITSIQGNTTLMDLFKRAAVAAPKIEKITSSLMRFMADFVHGHFRIHVYMRNGGNMRFHTDNVVVCGDDEATYLACIKISAMFLLSVP